MLEIDIEIYLEKFVRSDIKIKRIRDVVIGGGCLFCMVKVVGFSFSIRDNSWVQWRVFEILKLEGWDRKIEFKIGLGYIVRFSLK